MLLQTNSSSDGIFGREFPFDVFWMKSKFFKWKFTKPFNSLRYTSSIISEHVSRRQGEITEQIWLHVITAGLLKSIFNESEEMRDFAWLHFYLPQSGVYPPSYLGFGRVAPLLNTLWLHLKKAKCSSALTFPGCCNRLSLHICDVHADMRAR